MEAEALIGFEIFPSRILFEVPLFKKGLKTNSIQVKVDFQQLEKEEKTDPKLLNSMKMNGN